MEKPEGTVLPGDEGKVMWLRKYLYGLKQAPRQWNILIDGVLKKLGFTRLKSDVGIYMKGDDDHWPRSYRLVRSLSVEARHVSA